MMIRAKNICQIFRKLSTNTTNRFLQVCILGADTSSGQMLSFLLKQNPFISALHLQGSSQVEGLGVDLDHLDTRCLIRTYSGIDSVSKSLKSADIVVMLELSNSSKLSVTKLAVAEGPRVKNLSKNCTKSSPGALIIVAVRPISIMLPLVTEVFKESGCYHPGKLLGSVAAAQIRANSLAGHYQTLDPQIVQVPLAGGPDVDCALPLFTKCTPASNSFKDSKKLLKEFRAEDLNNDIHSAFGLNRMITRVAAGMNNDSSGNVWAFVRSNIIPDCKYMTSIVKIGKHGIVHNYGLQKLYKQDLLLFEEICLLLKKRQQMAFDLNKCNKEQNLPEFMINEIEEEKRLELGIIR